MKPSTAELTAALLAVFEGEKLEAYEDSGGIWTIGIGHTKDVLPGQRITHEESVRLLAADESLLFSVVTGFPTLQAAALASFGFNCGRQTLQNVLQGKDAIDLPRHTQDRHGNTLPGLVARRRLEGMLIELAKP